MTNRTPRRRREAGFSFIEVVIASLLLLVIAIGILPLFTQAAASNETGREYMLISNFAKSRAEEFMELPFNSTPLTIASGTQLVFDEYYSLKTHTWKTGTLATATSAGDPAQFSRTTTVRQFSRTDLATPLPAGSAPGSIHLKEITVQVQSVRVTGLLGSGRQTTVRIFKGL